MPMKEGYFKPCCFHGSGQPDINNFILGVQGVGELEVPLNCIWVTTSYGNARAFVNLTLKPRRGLLRGFIYPVELPSSCIVADTKDPDALSKFHADLIIWKRIPM